MDAEQKQRAHTILRDLKGARISILLALFVEAMPTTQEKLALVVPYSTRTIRDELKFLEHNNYVQRVHYRAWQLPNGNQLPLPGFEHLASGRAGSLPPGGEAEAADFAASAYVRTTTTSPPEAANFAGSEPNQAVVVSNKVRAKAADFAASEIPAEIRAALVDIRINGEAINTSRWPELTNAQQLVSGEPVTARYLRATAARVNQHPKVQYRNSGFFVHCVLSGDEEPEGWCEACDGLGGQHNHGCRLKYVTGKYADLVPDQETPG